MSFETNDLNGNGLQALISQTGYQPSSPEQLPEGVNLSFAGEQPVGDAAGIVPNVVQPDVQSQVPGVTPSQPVSQQQGVDPAIVQRLQQTMFEAATARIEAEEAKFEAEIAHLPDWQKEQARDKRELDQTRAVNSWMNNRIMTERQQREESAQAIAKRNHGFVVAYQHGLAFNNPVVREYIMGSPDPQTMKQRAAELVQQFRSQQAAQAQGQAANGIFAAGGAVDAAAPGPKPVMRSGDLGPLIDSTPYKVVVG